MEGEREGNREIGMKERKRVQPVVPESDQWCILANHT